jgi:hypothetical protein
VPLVPGDFTIAASFASAEIATVSNSVQVAIVFNNELIAKIYGKSGAPMEVEKWSTGWSHIYIVTQSILALNNTDNMYLHTPYTRID